jgi:uncharacterized repeat protein (TIGR02543 family)
VGRYAAADVWKDFTNITAGGLIFSAKVNNSALGSLSGTAQGLYSSGTSISITATPAAGYDFYNWTSRSGAQVSTSLALSFSLTQDSVLTAHFGKAQTVPLTAAGTLKDVPGISTVSHLTLTGDIDARDVQFMRDNMSVLVALDLTGASVVAYDGAEGTYPYGVTSYPANEMPLYSFFDPSSYTAKTGLTSVKLPASLTRIGESAFMGCNGLTGALTLPSSLSAIEDNAFANCSGLTSLTLPSGLSTIGNSAFYNCNSLTSVTFPNGLTNIGSYAFQNCRNLTSLTLPSGLNAIESGAFYNCSGLTSLMLPSGLSTIGSSAFNGCSGLTGALTFPSGLSAIESYAFYDCYSLTSLTLPGNLSAIGNYAFAYCDDLNVITNLNPTAIYITNNVFSGVNKSACTLTVPASAVGLYTTADVWKDFTNITSGGLIFSAKVNYPALGSLIGTTQGLYSSGTAISITAAPAASYGLLYWTDRSGAQVSTVATLDFSLTQDSLLTAHFGKVQTANLAAAGTLKDVPNISTVTHLTLTGNIDARDVQFMRDNMPTLTELDLEGASVVAYTGMEGTYPYGLTSYPANEMPMCSFFDLSSYTAKTGLTSVKLPVGLTSVGEYAFSGCNGLTELTLPSGLTNIGSYAFQNCSSLTSLTLPSGLNAIESGAFYNCNSLTSVTLPSELTNIGGSAFESCSSLTSLTLLGSATAIEGWAFYNCSSLTSITNLNPTPVYITNSVFGGVNKSVCALKVRNAAAVVSYQTATVWKDFLSITVSTYTITYHQNGGTGATDGTYTVESIISLPTPTKTGYTFAGWYDNAGLTGPAVTTIPTGSTGNKAFWAKWTVTVSFDSDGGSAVASQTDLTEGVYILQPANPTKTGFTFAGWYKEVALTNLWNFVTDVVTSNITLYAKWVNDALPVYTVTFNSDGGSAVAPQSVAQGEHVLQPIDPTKTGSTFAGWYKEAACTNAWNFAADAVSATVTLYVKWTPIQYTVAFNSNGGSVVVPQTVNYGNTASVPSPAPTRTGYSLTGWNNGAAAYNFADAVTGDLTLTAQWTISNYAVTFNSDGGSTVAPQSVAHGNTATKPTDPTKTGYSFAGWYNGAAAYNFADAVTDILTLTAQWTPDSYTVTFDSDGGSAVAPQNVNYGSTATKPVDPTKTGFSFAGWYNGAAVYNFSAAITGNLTLKAHWTEKSTGVADQLQVDVKLYPNPFISELHLTGAEGCVLRVISVAGAVLHTQKVLSPDETISLERLPAGLYFFRLEKDGKTKTVKAAKE